MSIVSQLIFSFVTAVVVFLIAFISIKMSESFQKHSNNKRRNYFEVVSESNGNIIYVSVGNCNVLQSSYVDRLHHYIRENSIRDGKYIIDFKNNSFLKIN